MLSENRSIEESSDLEGIGIVRGKGGGRFES